MSPTVPRALGHKIATLVPEVDATLRTELQQLLPRSLAVLQLERHAFSWW